MASTVTRSLTQARDRYGIGIPGHIIRYASHNTLPLPVSSSSSESRNRRTTSSTTASAIRRIDVKQCFKILVASAVGIMGVVATWWALDLAMWTAVKDYRDDCRNSASEGYEVSQICKDALKEELGPPPTWRPWRSFTSSSEPPPPPPTTTTTNSTTTTTDGGTAHRKIFKRLAATVTRDAQQRWEDWLAPISTHFTFGPAFAKIGNTPRQGSMDPRPWDSPKNLFDDDGDEHEDGSIGFLEYLDWYAEKPGLEKETNVMRTSTLLSVSVSHSPSPTPNDSRPCRSPQPRRDACYRYRRRAGDVVARDGIRFQGPAEIMYDPKDRSWTPTCLAWRMLDDDDYHDEVKTGFASQDDNIATYWNGTVVDLSISHHAFLHPLSPPLDARGGPSNRPPPSLAGLLRPAATVGVAEIIQTVVLVGMLGWWSYRYLSRSGGVAGGADDGRKMLRNEQDEQQQQKKRRSGHGKA